MGKKSFHCVSTFTVFVVIETEIKTCASFSMHVLREHKMQLKMSLTFSELQLNIPDFKPVRAALCIMVGSVSMKWL